jgi:hypothetical protein
MDNRNAIVRALVIEPGLAEAVREVIEVPSLVQAAQDPSSAGDAGRRGNLSRGYRQDGGGPTKPS